MINRAKNERRYPNLGKGVLIDSFVRYIPLKDIIKDNVSLKQKTHQLVGFFLCGDGRSRTAVLFAIT